MLQQCWFIIIVVFIYTKYTNNTVFVLRMMGRQVCTYLRKLVCATDNVRVKWLGRLTEQPSLARSVDPRSRILLLFAFFRFGKR
jgi:hypothetical protein